jgi:hypothetical protein
VSENRTIYDNLTKISGHLCKTDPGEHAMLLYDDITSFRDIYSSHCKKALLSVGRSVMILSHYEIKASVIHALKEVELNVERHENDGSLILVDATEMLSRSQNIVDFLRYLLTAEMAAKKRGKKRLDVVLDMGCFYHLNRLEDICVFEKSLSVRTENLSTVICCHNKKDFARLDSRIRENIELHHAMSFVIVENQ